MITIRFESVEDSIDDFVKKLNEKISEGRRLITELETIYKDCEEYEIVNDEQWVRLDNKDLFYIDYVFYSFYNNKVNIITNRKYYDLPDDFDLDDIDDTYLYEADFDTGIYDDCIWEAIDELIEWCSVNDSDHFYY